MPTCSSRWRSSASAARRSTARATRWWRTSTRTRPRRRRALNLVGRLLRLRRPLHPARDRPAPAGRRPPRDPPRGDGPLRRRRDRERACRPTRRPSRGEACRSRKRRGSLRDPLVLLLGLLLFFQSGNEFILGGYTTTFLTREIGLERRRRLVRPHRVLGRAHADPGLARPRTRVPHRGAPRAGERRRFGSGHGASRDRIAPAAGRGRGGGPRSHGRRHLPGRPRRRRLALPRALRHRLRPALHDGPLGRDDAAVGHRPGGGRLGPEAGPGPRRRAVPAVFALQWLVTAGPGHPGSASTR